MPNRANNEFGFTLIEALVTLAIIGILVGAAIWSAQRGVANRTLEGSVRTLSSDIATAKALAVKHGRRFQIVLAPGTSTTYTIRREVLSTEVGYNAADPFATFAGPIATTPDKATFGASSVTIALTTNFAGNTIEFAPRGTLGGAAPAAGAVQLALSGGDRQRRIDVSLTGRVSICTVGVDAGCNSV